MCTFNVLFCKHSLMNIISTWIQCAWLYCFLGGLIGQLLANWMGASGLQGNVSVRSKPDSAAMCGLTRGLHLVLSPWCVAEDPRSGERFQVCADRGFPRLQLAPSWWWCVQKEASDQLVIWMSFLGELRRHTRKWTLCTSKVHALACLTDIWQSVDKNREVC